ncbi:MAG: S8 family serine peptidase [Bryobacteraceae bacterium]|nr:S8 family serine peptidase [Bryobacteraceae bacterium]
MHCRIRLLTALFLSAPVPVLFAQGPPTKHVPNRVLVKFKDGVSKEAGASAVKANGGASERVLEQINLHVVTLPANASEAAFVNRFKGLKDVEFAELDEIHDLQQEVVPNDPAYTSQWHLKKIAAPTAWSQTTGSTSVIVAILDTGVDSTHPDLAARIVPGWNVYDNNANTADVYGHGTKVAGTAVATTNNAWGVAGIAWNCLIMPIRVSTTTGSASSSAISSGLIKAADLGARVANVSYKVSNNLTVQNGAKYFNGKGGVVTISAGNYSTNVTDPDDPYVLTVAATDEYDRLYSWSNYGSNLDVSAPGCVTTTLNGGGIGGTCGTSFSAPVTAGVAALVLSARPGLSAAEAMSIIRSSSDDLGVAGWDTTFGAGRVNAAKAVAAALNTTVSTDTTAPSVRFVSPAAGATVSGTITVSVSASDNIGVTGLTVTVDGGSSTSASTFVLDTTKYADGPHTLAATARDAAGNTATSSITITVKNAPADTTPPTVTITSPASGSVLQANSTFTAVASDNVAVAKVEFFLNGSPAGSVAAAPYTVRYNSRKLGKGSYTLTAVATDTSGNRTTSSAIAVSK